MIKNYYKYTVELYDFSVKKIIFTCHANIVSLRQSEKEYGIFFNTSEKAAKDLLEYMGDDIMPFRIKIKGDRPNNLFIPVETPTYVVVFMDTETRDGIYIHEE